MRFDRLTRDANLRRAAIGCLVAVVLDAGAGAQPSPGSLAPCPDTLDAYTYAGGALTDLSCACWRPTVAPVWGTDIYTSDSAICAAAVHAGILTMGGGTVYVRLERGRQSYAGTTRNGITSQAHGPARGSFRIERNTAPYGAPPRR